MTSQILTGRKVQQRNEKKKIRRGFKAPGKTWWINAKKQQAKKSKRKTLETWKKIFICTLSEKTVKYTRRQSDNQVTTISFLSERVFSLLTFRFISTRSLISFVCLRFFFQFCSCFLLLLLRCCSAECIIIIYFFFSHRDLLIIVFCFANYRCAESVNKTESEKERKQRERGKKYEHIFCQIFLKNRNFLFHLCLLLYIIGTLRMRFFEIQWFEQ